MGCFFSLSPKAKQEQNLRELDAGASEVRGIIDAHKRDLNQNNQDLKELQRACDGKKPAANSPQMLAIVAHLKKKKEILGAIKEEDTRLRSFTRTADAIRRMQLNKDTVGHMKKLDAMVRSIKLDTEETDKVIGDAADAMADVDEYNRAVEEGMQDMHAATTGRSPLRDAPDEDGGLNERELKQEIDDLFAVPVSSSTATTDSDEVELAELKQPLRDLSIASSDAGAQQERTSLLPTRVSSRVAIAGVDTS